MQIQSFGFRSWRTLFRQGTFWFEKQVHWRWHNEHATVSTRQHFRDLWEKGFPPDSRHSNGHQSCPSPSRHFAVLIRSGIHTVFALGWKEIVSISIQLHISIRLWRIGNQSINPDFHTYLGQMYPAELEIKTRLIAIPLPPTWIYSCRYGQLRTSLYDKRDDWNFHITKFPFLDSNIPSSPAYGVLISQLIRYARAFSSYECFILRAARLSCKLLGQVYVRDVWNRPSGSSMVDIGDLINHYEVSLSRMLHVILGHGHIQWHPPLIRHFTT